MKPMLMLLIALVAATPARAATVNWLASGALTWVDDVDGLFPGLTLGTPWTLSINFDPYAPGTPGSGSLPGTNFCNVYPIGSTTFTLGGFTYTSSGGTITTNTFLYLGCNSIPQGDVEFEWGVPWIQEPGAWDLNGSGGRLMAGYFDAISDGSLPIFPTIQNEGIGVGYRATRTYLPLFHDYPFGPTSVIPEPGTFAMLSLGLAYMARRRLLHTRPPS